MPDFNATNMPQYHKVGLGVLAATTITHGIYCESFGLQKIPTHVEDKGVYGKAWGRSENVIEDKITCSGPIVFRPRRDNLAFLLPMITGTSPFSNAGMEMGLNGDSFPIWHLAKIGIHKFPKCKIDVATFSSSKSDTMLKLTMAVEALDMVEDLTLSNFPGESTVPFSLDKPFVHTQTTIMIDGEEYRSEDISIAINRSLIKDEHLNSKTRLDLPDGERIVTLDTTIPFNDANDQLLQRFGDSAVAASVLYTNGEYDLKFEFPALQSPVKSPVFTARTPMRQSIQWTARSLDGNAITSPCLVTLAAVT